MGIWKHIFWKLNMTEQIFRTLTYFSNLFSTQILSHITLFNSCSFPASLQLFVLHGITLDVSAVLILS